MNMFKCCFGVSPTSNNNKSTVKERENKSKKTGNNQGIQKSPDIHEPPACTDEIKENTTQNLSQNEDDNIGDFLSKFRADQLEKVQLQIQINNACVEEINKDVKTKEAIVENFSKLEQTELLIKKPSDPTLKFPLNFNEKVGLLRTGNEAMMKAYDICFKTKQEEYQLFPLAKLAINEQDSGAYGQVLSAVSKKTNQDYAVKINPISDYIKAKPIIDEMDPYFYMPKIKTSRIATKNSELHKVNLATMREAIINYNIREMKNEDKKNDLALKPLSEPIAELCLKDEDNRNKYLFEVMGMYKCGTLLEHKPGAAMAGIYMKQLAEALALLHSKGVVHRDIKPGNILIQEEKDKNGKVCKYNAKLIDFGFSTVKKDHKMSIHPELGSIENVQGKLTGVVGTEVYLDPTLYSNLYNKDKASLYEYSDKSDTYSLGASMICSIFQELFPGQVREEKITGDFAESFHQYLKEYKQKKPTYPVTQFHILLMSCISKNITLRPDDETLIRRLSSPCIATPVDIEKSQLVLLTELKDLDGDLNSKDTLSPVDTNKPQPAILKEQKVLDTSVQTK
ncbi:MAG: protein kinase [bacterium]|nr:protein kinase [bacterium]